MGRKADAQKERFGRERTPAEFHKLLEAADFEFIGVTPTGGPTILSPLAKASRLNLERVPTMSTIVDLHAGEMPLDTPWYRQISPAQWRAFWATFLGWVIDAFDFNILAFILIDIQKSFSVDRALVGALGTITLAMRVVGGIAAGTAADKIGRKLPLMLSILWFSVFAFLSGFARSYAMLFVLRALFGIGMGGEWAAGTPLDTVESVKCFRTVIVSAVSHPPNSGMY